jgi:hypothetical protein
MTVTAASSGRNFSMNTITLMAGAVVVALMLAACAGKQTVPPTPAYNLPRPEQTRSKWVDPALGNDTVEERANTSPRSEQTQAEKETSVWVKDFKQKLFDYTDASDIWIDEACGKVEKDTNRLMHAPCVLDVLGVHETRQFYVASIKEISEEQKSGRISKEQQLRRIMNLFDEQVPAMLDREVRQREQRRAREVKLALAEPIRSTEERMRRAATVCEKIYPDKNDFVGRKRCLLDEAGLHATKWFFSVSSKKIEKDYDAGRMKEDKLRASVRRVVEKTDTLAAQEMQRQYEADVRARRIFFEGLEDPEDIEPLPSQEDIIHRAENVCPENSKGNAQKQVKEMVCLWFEMGVPNTTQFYVTSMSLLREDYEAGRVDANQVRAKLTEITNKTGEMAGEELNLRWDMHRRIRDRRRELVAQGRLTAKESLAEERRIQSRLRELDLEAQREALEAQREATRNASMYNLLDSLQRLNPPPRSFGSTNCLYGSGVISCSHY